MGIKRSRSLSLGTWKARLMMTACAHTHASQVACLSLASSSSGFTAFSSLDLKDKVWFKMEVPFNSSLASSDGSDDTEPATKRKGRLSGGCMDWTKGSGTGAFKASTSRRRKAAEALGKLSPAHVNSRNSQGWGNRIYRMTMNCHYKQSLGEVTLVYFLVCCLFHQTLNRIFGDLLE